jgi:hypothetical protein
MIIKSFEQGKLRVWSKKGIKESSEVNAAIVNVA